MAKVIEKSLIVKFSKIVRDNDRDNIEIIDSEQLTLIEQTILSVIDEIIADKPIVVEIVES